VGGQGYTLNKIPDGLKHSEIMANQHHRPLSSTTRFEKHTQLTTGLPWHHEYSRLVVRITGGPGKADQLSLAMSGTEI